MSGYSLADEPMPSRAMEEVAICDSVYDGARRDHFGPYAHAVVDGRRLFVGYVCSGCAAQSGSMLDELRNNTEIFEVRLRRAGAPDGGRMSATRKPSGVLSVVTLFCESCSVRLQWSSEGGSAKPEPLCSAYAGPVCPDCLRTSQFRQTIAASQASTDELAKIVSAALEEHHKSSAAVVRLLELDDVRARGSQLEGRARAALPPSGMSSAFAAVDCVAAAIMAPHTAGETSKMERTMGTSATGEDGLLEKAAAWAKKLGVDQMALRSGCTQAVRLVREPLLDAARAKLRGRRGASNTVALITEALGSDAGEGAVRLVLAGAVRFVPVLPVSLRLLASEELTVSGGAKLMDAAAAIIMDPLVKALGGFAQVMGDPDVQRRIGEGGKNYASVLDGRDAIGVTPESAKPQ